MVDGLAGSFGFALTALSWKELENGSEYDVRMSRMSLVHAYRESDILDGGAMIEEEFVRERFDWESATGRHACKQFGH